MKKFNEVDRHIWSDGVLIPWHEATVHVLSHSLQRGSLVFDYMSIKQTPLGEAIFRMDAHLRRLFRSCRLMGLALERDESELAEAILETVRANPGARVVKISVLIPSVEIDVVPRDSRVSVSIAAYDPVADILDRLPGEPVAKPDVLRLHLERHKRQRREDIVSPEAKVSANYVSSMMAKSKALEAGFHEILLMDAEGFIAEGPTANIFIVTSDGFLRTPPEQRVLRGVTRASVIALAEEMKIPCFEESISPDELFAAEEAFMTGTSASILPVESVDGHKMGTDCPGSVTVALRERLIKIERGEDPAFESWLTYVKEAPA